MVPPGAKKINKTFVPPGTKRINKTFVPPGAKRINITFFAARGIMGIIHRAQQKEAIFLDSLQGKNSF
jgi:hypothetical protein